MSELRRHRDGSHTFWVTGPANTTIATLGLNEWETRFFGRPMGRLTVATEAAAALSSGQWPQAVSLITKEANAYDLVQAQLDVRHLALAPALEAAGFRLVDTRVSFVTRLDRRSWKRHEAPIGETRLAVPGDLPDLLALAHRHLTRNPDFYSRYKHPAYFTREETARWFSSWVAGNLADPGSLVAVWRVEDRTVGFFGYLRQGDRKGRPFYKSTLAAVDESGRGHKAYGFLQTVLFDSMPSDEFWVENTTRLTNPAVIHNHLLTGRRLNSIELAFFRRPDSARVSRRQEEPAATQQGLPHRAPAVSLHPVDIPRNVGVPRPLEVRDSTGGVIATLRPDAWETRFFRRSVGHLLPPAEPSRPPASQQWHEAVSLLAEEIDAYDLVQAQLDVRCLTSAQALEDAGFRLVDTRVSFLARIDDADTLSREPPFGTMRLASPDDRAALTDLTHRCLTLDPGFVSRYKNPSYFAPGDARRWFEAWVENKLKDPDAMTAIWEVEGRPVGFLGYHRQGTLEGLPVFAASLAAVEPDWRGHKAQLFLQSYLYRRMHPYPVWVRSTTQLSNFPTLCNAISSGKKVTTVELTFLRTSRA